MKFFLKIKGISYNNSDWFYCYKYIKDKYRMGGIRLVRRSE